MKLAIGILSSMVFALLVALVAAGALVRARSGECDRLAAELDSVRSRGRLRRDPSAPDRPGSQGSPASSAPGVEPPLQESDRQALERHIAVLEAEIKRRDAVDRELLASVKMPLDLLGKGRAVDKSEIPAVQAKVLDPTLSPKERVDALGVLRDSDPASRTPEIVRSMVLLLQTTDESRIRADICRYLHGCVDDGLKTSLLQMVRTDSSSVVREKAVECLGDMKDDPVVQATIEQVLQGDASDKVRSRARRALSGE